MANLRKLRGHLNIRNVVLTFFGITALGVFSYGILFVLLPAQELKAGTETKCKILSADLACWRRAPFSFSHIERGHYSCWLMRAEPISSNTSKLRGQTGSESFLGKQSPARSQQNKSEILPHFGPFQSQYTPVHDFSKSRDGCRSFSECGNVSWSCVIVTGRHDFGRLKWRYPTKDIAVSISISMALGIVLIAMIVQSKMQARKKKTAAANSEKDEAAESDDDNRTVWSSGFNSVTERSDRPRLVRPVNLFDEDTNFSRNMTTDEIIEHYENKQYM